MLCEDYRETLTEAAARNSAPSPELRSHLDACGPCRAAFTEELQLYAAIDTGVRAMANAEVAAALLPRVQAQLSEQNVARRSWFPVSAAIATAAAIVMVIVLVRSHGRDAVETDSPVGSIALSVAPAETKPALPEAISLEKLDLATKNRTVRAVPIVPAPKIEEVAVLIPAGQRQAIDALLMDVQVGKVDGELLLARTPERKLEELEVTPLVVSPIEVKPLAGVSAASVEQNKSTRR